MTYCRYSIVLPVRNGRKYIEPCVRSILRQRLSDFELVILDDCSDDGSIEWVSEVTDSRVRILRSPVPRGLEANWKRIGPAVRGEFLTIVGHDDLLDPDYLEVMDQLIRRFPDASLYHAHFRLINSEGRTIRRCAPIPAKETPAHFLSSRLNFERDSFGTGYVMRSDAFQRVGGIPPFKRLLYADDALWLRLMQGSWKATTEEECFSYRLHPASISHRPYWKDSLDALGQYTTFLMEYQRINPEVHAILRSQGPNFFRAVYRGLHLIAMEQGESVDLPSRNKLLSMAHNLTGEDHKTIRHGLYPRIVESITYLLTRPGVRNMVHPRIMALITSIPNNHICLRIRDLILMLARLFRNSGQN